MTIDLLIRNTLEAFARQLGYPEWLREIPVQVWIKLLQSEE